MSIVRGNEPVRATRTPRWKHLACAMFLSLILYLPTGTGSGARDLYSHEREVFVMPEIRATEVGTKVAIIGTLGARLGQVVTIRGEWSKRNEFGEIVYPKTLCFVVSSIDSVPVKAPVAFERHFVSGLLPDLIKPLLPSAGDIWEMRGIEVGTYCGIPASVLRELPGYAIPAAPCSFGFYPEFRYFTRKVVGSKPQELK